MCLTCTLNAGAASWIDAGETTREDKARAKALRVRLLGRALAGHDIRVEPSALGAGLRLTAADGNAILSEDMSEIWAWVEGVLGRAWDPLAA